MYGELPKLLGNYEVDCKEMLFYQYLPIKLKGEIDFNFEKRLNCFNELIEECFKDYIMSFGIEKFIDSYIYLTAKKLFQVPNCSFNRLGYHSDGFMTKDINYIWCDKFPTIFNTSKYNLTLNDEISLKEMEEQSLKENEKTFKENDLLRLNEFNIHRVSEIDKSSLRTFFKLSFSADKYDLIGNSHNYTLDYNWDMKERKESRNIPQTIITESEANNE